MRFDHVSAAQDRLWELMTEKWKFTHPSLVLSVAGGAIAENYYHQYLQAALRKLVRDTSKRQKL